MGGLGPVRLRRATRGDFKQGPREAESQILGFARQAADASWSKLRSGETFRLLKFSEAIGKVW